MIVDFPSIVGLVSSLVLLGDAFMPTSATPQSNSGTNVLSQVLNSSGDAGELSATGGLVATMQRSAIYLAKAIPPQRPSVVLPAIFSVLFIASIFATVVFRLMVKYDARYKSLTLAHDVTFVFLVNAVLTGIATSGRRLCTLFRLVHTDAPMLHLGIRELLTVLVLLEAILLTGDFIAESNMAIANAKGEISLNDEDEPAPYALGEKNRLGAEQV